MAPVRRLLRRERDDTLRLIIDAFRYDPQVRWWFPEDTVYADAAPRFFGFLLDSRIAGGEVWVAGDLSAVSLWVPPGGNLLGPDVIASRYADLVAALPDPAPARITATDLIVDDLLPDEPHWYLGVLACRAADRGRGLGSAVLKPVFDAADRAGLPVALETSTPVNVDFYRRRGFSVVATRAAEEADSPALRVMRREPSRLAASG
jgi:GNAT superfamily N-acetyltransferase